MKKVPRNVFILGLVSFFNDMASEMIYPIVPIFLTTVLKTSIPIFGIIEGITEATAAFTKYLFGSLSDYFKKRKIFVVLGYFFSAISKIFIGLSQSWFPVMIARFLDKSGKGLRTAPRDSILLENTDSNNRGFVFGFHRAMDSAGAVFGPLLALFFLYFLKENIRMVFFIAFIPSIIGVILLLLLIKEKNVFSQGKKHFVKINYKNLEKPMKIFFITNFIFALGNSSDAFLILRAKNLGLTTLMATLTYVIYNVSYTVFSTPAGSLADKIGAKKVFQIGLFVFSLVYFFFGFIKNPIFFWILFPIYGIYIAFTDGVSKAYMSKMIKKEESASYFGLQQTILGVGALLASTVGGILWYKMNPSATFYYGSFMSALALVIFTF